MKHNSEPKEGSGLAPEVETVPHANDTQHSTLNTQHSPLEAEIAAAIEPWLAHMRWRKDFAAWRKRRIWQENYQAANVAAVRAALGGAVAGKRLLDLGSGMGGLAVALAREGATLVGLDYNPAYCAIARLRARRYGLTLPLIVGAGEALPFPAGSFAVVINLDVLEHVRDPAQVVAEIARVLRPGGACLTSAPNRFAFRDAHYHLPGINWLPRPWAETVIRRAGHGKEQGSLLTDRQALSALNTYTWAGFAALARRQGLRAVDQVEERLRGGEIRQLTGIRRGLLQIVRRAGLLVPIYRVYRCGWQGTFQARLEKPRRRR
ncbi:MAG: class I SAM-dependent methyltransferase [Chloroflexota bacterium]|nr:class I SAM-dependent methyltransferase [Chloroflexota bacterium]